MAKFSIEFETKGAQQAIEAYNGLSKAEQRAVKEVLALDQGQQRMERSAKKAAQAGTIEFGRMAQQMIGLSSAQSAVQKGVQILTDSYRKLREEREKAATGLEAQVQAEAKFKSISGGSVDRERELIERTRQVQRKTGLDASQSADLVFRLASAGQDQDLQDFIDLQNVERDPTQVSAIQDAAAVLRSNLGRAEVGTAREQINKIRAAGALNESGGAAEIGQQATQAAAGAKFLGSSDEELLAVLAAVFPALKDSTGASVGALFTELNDKGFGTGEGGLSAVDAFIAAGKTEKDLSVRSQKAFSVINENREGIIGFENEIDLAGRGTGTAGDQLAIDSRAQTQEQKAALAASTARSAVALAETEAFGATELERQATLDKLRQEDIEADINPLTRLVNRAKRSAFSFGADTFGASPDEETLRAAGSAGILGSLADFSAHFGILIDLLQIIASNTGGETQPTSGDAP